MFACYHAARIFPVAQQVDAYFFKACFEHPSTIETLIRKAEGYRLKLAEIEQFKIKEEETVQILAEGTPLRRQPVSGMARRIGTLDMPRETIHLGLSNPFTPEPGAQYCRFLLTRNLRKGG